MAEDKGIASSLPTSTPMTKRSVSFGPSSTEPTSTSTPVSNNTPKSAIKPGKEKANLPPQEQYQHTDPLLRRLRLVDSNGKPLNLKEQFGPDTKVVGFYFSSQWAGQPLKEYHKTISDFCRRHPHQFKVIYVSVDVDEQWYKAGTKDKPWVSMAWNDGSSLPDSTPPSPSIDSDSKEDSEPTLHNSENFLLASEPDIDEALSHTDTSGEAYLRPFSRVHLAAKLNILAAPTLCVYSVENKKMLDWNVRVARLKDGSGDETWERWEKGEGSKAWGFLDAAQQNPVIMVITILSLMYFLLVRVGGEQYNFIGSAMEALTTMVEGKTGGAANIVGRN